MMDKPLVLVTGAAGFIGRHLTQRLCAEKVKVRPVVRQESGIEGETVVGDISSFDGWHEHLVGVDAIVHLAGRAHVIHDTASDPLGEFRRVNVDATLRLAASAMKAGVRRFVFVSSIGVFGDQSDGPFTERSAVQPVQEYAISKWEAERALGELMSETDMELVIVRPPLVFGPGVVGNMLRLLDLVRMPLPLPLGSVENRRSLVGVRNLAEFLALCVIHPLAHDQIFVIAEETSLSTPDLIRRIEARMQRRRLIFRFPVSFLRGLAAIIGRRREMESLVGDLEVDPKHARELLGWRPLFSQGDEIDRMVDWYLEARKS